MGWLSTLILFLFYSLNQAASKEYYITANSTDLCTSSCLTLTEFVTNFSHLLNPNVTVVFSPGIHYLNGSLTVSNLDTFSMTSENITAQIECTSNSQMIFNYSQNIFVTNLEYIGCGGNQMMNVDNFVIQDATFIDQDNRGITLQFIETTGEIINCAFSSLHWTGTIGGVVIAINSSINISQSRFEYNGAREFFLFTRADGSVIRAWQSIIYINASTFISNYVQDGVIYSSDSSRITIEESEFYYNFVSLVLISYNSSAEIERSAFVSNVAFGNTLLFESCEVIIRKSNFYLNYVYSSSIALFLNSNITIEGSNFGFNGSPGQPTVILGFNNSISTIDTSEFSKNTGSVVLSTKSRIEITASVFDNNTEAALLNIIEQGMVLGCSNGTIIINNCNFTNNNAPVIVVLNSIVEHYNSLLIVNNSIKSGNAIIHFDNSEFIGHDSGSATVSNNLRSLLAFASNITFKGNIEFIDNQQLLHLQEGGAITLVRSNLFLGGTCRLKHNHAENGGAIFSFDSNLYVSGNVTVAHNTANRNGGGVYLTDSELICQDKGNFTLLNNSAEHKGGGIHSISSSIKVTSVLKETQVDTAILNFTNNIAERGGGLYLEANARLVVLKYKYGDILFGPIFTYSQSDSIIFSANSANYGGAVYVDDDTSPSTCTSDPMVECFFQVLAYIQGLYSMITIPDTTLDGIGENLKPLSLHFTENNASISGSTLYGGLLDRCAVSRFAEVRTKYEEDYAKGGNGIMYLKHVSNIRDTSISSRPVKVCLCMDNEHNCTHQRLIEVKKGETFTVSLASIDEINHPVNGLIHASLKFPGSAVASGQATREIPAKCTNLTFNVFSPHSSEQLTLYALDGPCKDANLSKISVDINFLNCSCLIGLQIVETNDTNCICTCHRIILQYVDECNSFTGAFHRQPQSRAWIAFTNGNNSELSGYLVYPNCPFDYCNSLNILIDLNQPKGTDMQCAFNRSSLLCGSCQPGLSLSLGGSHCLQCPIYWPALLIAITIAAILAGIALVTLLLVLNMTVAVGTLNGLIFYANVVYANRSILVPFQGTNFVIVFLSWLNLELGIDTCYFPGMDTFRKTWLQLVFPAYIILLVALVIIISSYSSRFSNLIGKKNPVATLATLILLSYAKLLEICFKSLSFGRLNYPDGSIKMVWLPDATIQYLSGKYILLFLAAVLILLVGVVYTALLFSWQWLLRLPKWRIFRWTRCLKLQTFIETYHTPYTPKHRYWTGLLLIARAVLYLVAAVNVSNDPTIALTAIFFVICCILALKAFIGSRVYRKCSVDILETFFYLNILLFTTFTWYCLGECRNKKAAAYTSAIIMFGVLLLIIFYHVYTYTTVFSKVKQTKPMKMLKKVFITSSNDPKPELNVPPDDDAHGLYYLLNIIDVPVNANDYKVPVKPAEPTSSVVEVHKPQLPSPDAEEIIVQNVPISTEVEVYENKV